MQLMGLGACLMAVNWGMAAVREKAAEAKTMN